MDGNGWVGMSASGHWERSKVAVVAVSDYSGGVAFLCFGYCIAIVFIVGKTAIIPPHLSSCFKWFSYYIYITSVFGAQQFRVAHRLLLLFPSFQM